MLMESWRTALVSAGDGSIRIQGYPVAALMERSFADVVFLLHRGKLPTAAERRLLDAILVASADHGSGAPSCAAARLAASGNRQSLSAAVAAGVLAIGDEHGGAGETCMEWIAAGVERARREDANLCDTTSRVVSESKAAGIRIPGLGHRVHSLDPRTGVLFNMARAHGLAADGVVYMEALASAVAAQIKPLALNIDGALAAILFDLGFPPPAGKLLFIIGRVAGLTAEVYEEHTREKPMRIRIPVEYDGVPPREL